MKKELKIKKSIVLLFADDNPNFRVTLTRYLKNHYSASKIIEASNGTEAIEKTVLNIPDLVILDIKMKGLSGLDVVKIIKKDYPFIPVVILTNYDDPEYKQEAKKVLADAFIAKKNLVSELGSIIDVLLSSPV